MEVRRHRGRVAAGGERLNKQPVRAQDGRPSGRVLRAVLRVVGAVQIREEVEHGVRILELPAVEMDLEHGLERRREVGVRAQLLLGQLRKGGERLVPAAAHEERIGRLGKRHELAAPAPAPAGEREQLAEVLERFAVAVAAK